MVLYKKIEMRALLMKEGGMVTFLPNQANEHQFYDYNFKI